MKNPKISVVTVCFNVEDTIEETVKSVLSQDYENIEYIVIDGASKDSTLEILKKYQKDIDVLVSESDKGIYDAMNKGWQRATGEYIYYLNSGDSFVDGKVISNIAKKLDKDFVYGNIIASSKGEEFRISKRINRRSLRRGKKIIHQTVFMRRSILKKLGGFDLSYRLSADYDIYCKVFYNDYTVAYVDLDIAKFDLGGASSNFSKAYSENVEIIRKNFGVLPAITYRLYSWYRLIVTRAIQLIGGDKLLTFVRKLIS